MLAEHGLLADGDAIARILETADVLTIGFTLFPERLLVDTRTSADEGPMVAIVAPVASVQDRYLWLGRHRGNFGSPENFSFFMWPHTVRSLVEQDILAPLRARLAAVSQDADATIAASLARLLEAERSAMRAAVRGGDGWQTLWQGAGTPR